MKYQDFKEQYKGQTEEEVRGHLADVIFNAFHKIIMADRLVVTEGVEGHRIKDISETSDTKNLRLFTQRLAQDIENQSVQTANLRKITDGKYQSVDIDIDDILAGNLEWDINSVFSPERSVALCQNDGKKYIMEMQNWHLTFYDKEEWVKNKKRVEIHAFDYDRSPVKEVIEFKTGDMIALNFLPRDLEDFIEGHYEQSTYDLIGRDWNKFQSEMLKPFGILRTPTHIGGTLVASGHNLVTGFLDTPFGFNSSEHDPEVPNIVGEIGTGKWQTLIMDHADAIDLLMKARNIDASDAEAQLDLIINELGGANFKLPSGTYNVYYIPDMNEGASYDTKSIFPKVNVECYQQITPDMIITKDELEVTRPIDPIKVCDHSDFEINPLAIHHKAKAPGLSF